MPLPIEKSGPILRGDFFDHAVEINRIAAIPFEESFGVAGQAIVKQGGSRYYPNRPCTIVGVRVSAGTAPTGAPLIVDVNLNGVSIFTAQGNRPQIPPGEYTSGFVAGMAVTAMSVTDYLTVDIDQIGTGTAGADVLVTVALLP